SACSPLYKTVRTFYYLTDAAQPLARRSPRGGARLVHGLVDDVRRPALVRARDNRLGGEDGLGAGGRARPDRPPRHPVGHRGRASRGEADDARLGRGPRTAD